MQPVISADQVREAGGKADEADCVEGVRVQGDHVGDGEPEELGDGGQVGTVGQTTGIEIVAGWAST